MLQIYEFRLNLFNKSRIFNILFLIFCICDKYLRIFDPMNAYLQTVIASYREGKYQETNLELMAQQSGTDVDGLFRLLRSNGVQFVYRPHLFRVKGGETVHAKGGDMIVLFKNKMIPK